MNKWTNGKQLGCVALVLVCGQAGADLKDPGFVNAGAFKLTPTVQIGMGFDDNVNTSQSNEVDANVFTVAPELLAETEIANHTQILFGAGGEKGAYAGEANNNYYDYHFDAGVMTRFNRSNEVALQYGYDRGHDEVGGVGSSGANTPDEYRVNRGGLYYMLGSDDTVGRIELALTSEGKRYTTNLPATASRDLDKNAVSLTGYFEVAPRTELLLQGIQRENDFIVEDDLDADDTVGYAGVKWEATGQTTGTAKIGSQVKEFDAGGDTDKVAWDIGVEWKPRSYSTFTANLSSDIGDGNSVAGNRIWAAVERETLALGWIHDWLDHVQTTVNLSSMNEAYLGGANNDVEADTLKLDAGVAVQAERNLTITAKVGHEDRDSDRASDTYTRNTFLLFGAEIGI